MPNKNKKLPVFVVVEMPEWKNKVLDFMLKLLFIKGKSFVVAMENTELFYNSKEYSKKK
jgi:hypothetical protein